MPRRPKTGTTGRGKGNEGAVELPGEWRVQGPHAAEFDPRQRLKPPRAGSGRDAAFKSALTFVLNTAYENGYLAPRQLAPLAEKLSASYHAWSKDAAPGSAWADINFPSIRRSRDGRPGLKLSTLFLATDTTTLLLAADTGVLLQAGGTTVLASRDFTGFASEGPVLVEVFVDLFEILMAAFGIVGNVDRLRQAATRIIFSNPRLLALLRRLVGFFGGASSSDDLVAALRELVELLFKAGVGADLINEFVNGWDWWDVAVFFISILALLFPASTGVKIAFILAKLADMGVELNRKYDRYQKGLPVSPVH